MTRPSGEAVFGMSMSALGLVLAVLCFVNGWREPFMQTSWLVGLGAALAIVSWRK